MLAVVQKMTEVDVEELARHFLHHEVSGVTISNSQDVGCHALACETLDVALVNLFQLDVGVFHGLDHVILLVLVVVKQDFGVVALGSVQLHLLNCLLCLYLLFSLIFDSLQVLFEM